MYYEQELTQAEIAKQMQLSRPTVGKMLNRAKEWGIVRIEIYSPLENVDLVLNQLQGLFNLQGGLVVPTTSTDENFVENLLFSQGALYVEGFFPDITTIGLGWGYAVGSFVQKLTVKGPKDRFSGKVFPIVGSSSDPSQWYQPNEFVRILGENIGFEPLFLHAPAFPLPQENQELFTRTIEYQNISALWSDIDAVIVGIGSYPSVPDQATAARFGDLLQEKEAVGMLATYFFDRQGSIITSENDLVIRIPLPQLRNAKRVIAIATGLSKVDSIIGALKTGLITHLITDERTARDVISSARN